MKNQQLAIIGGMLIDGTGRPPLQNSIILIENGRFKAIGQNGSISVPEGATTVDVTGLTVMPGFIDGHGHLEDFHGELYLHLGITTCAQIELYQDGPWSRAQKLGTQAGKIRGPRIWMSGRGIGGLLDEHDGFSSRVKRGNILVRSKQDIRDAIKRKVSLGCDIIKMNEFADLELGSAIVAEAHEHGLPVAAHSLDVIETARMGVDAIEHIWAVGYSSILYAPSRHILAQDRLAGKIDQEIAGSYFEPENYGPIIDAMVSRGVAWTPTIAKWLRPLSPSAERFRKREQEILNNPAANLPASVAAVTFNAYDKFSSRYSAAQLERAKIGYDKTNEFIRRFYEAGGRIKEGSDPPRGLAALLMHQALVMDVEAGVSPMAAIQAATLNVAKAFHKDADFGSVEVGKVADLSIVKGNPLVDIWCTQNVKHVVLDGEVVDTEFSDYENPIPSFYAYQSMPTDLDIFPRYVTAGGNEPITLKVRGGGMWPFHRVMLKHEFGGLFNLHSIELPTSYVSRTELSAVIDASLIANPGTYTITVKADGEPLAESGRTHLIVAFPD